MFDLSDSDEDHEESIDLLRKSQNLSGFRLSQAEISSVWKMSRRCSTPRQTSSAEFLPYRCGKVDSGGGRTWIAGASIFAGLYGEAYNHKDLHSKLGVLLSFIPALLIIFVVGDPFKGLIYSQMLLSIQLPITVFTQVYLTSSKKWWANCEFTIHNDHFSHFRSTCNLLKHCASNKPDLIQ